MENATSKMQVRTNCACGNDENNRLNDRLFHILGTNTVTFRGVTLRGGGAAILNPSSILNIEDSIIDGNFGDSAIDQGGNDLDILRSTIINNCTAPAGSVTIDQGDSEFVFNFLKSTCTNNFSTGASCIRFETGDGGIDANIANSTFSGNTSSNNVGTISTDSDSNTINIINATIVSNIGVGLRINPGTHTTNVENTIIAFNVSFTNMTFPFDCLLAGTLTSLGQNIDSDDSCFDPANATAACILTPGNDLADCDNTDILLNLTLADNGGPTLTHAITSDSSVAFNAGDNTTCEASPVDDIDQRCCDRTDATCDIGAYERNCVIGGPTPTPTLRLHPL